MTVSIPATPSSTSPGTTSQASEPTLSSSTVTLSWGGVSGATSYEVAVKDVNSNQFVVDQFVSGTSYTASLSSGHSYIWNVDAINSAGASHFSTPLYFLTPASVSIPATPSSTSPGTTSQASEPTLSSSAVTLSWGAVSGATSYEVAVKDVNTNQFVVDQFVSGTSYIASLSSGGSYIWNVDAINSAGASHFSTPLYFLTPTVTSTPSNYTISPGSPTVNENQGTLTFTVNRPSSVGSQTVYVSTVQDQGYHNAATGTTSTNYYYDGLANVAYTFVPGQNSIQVPIAIHDLGLTSGSEKFSFDVRSTTGTDLASTSFTILNNDAATTTYSVSPKPAAVNENQGTLNFTVTRSDSSTFQIVDISTVQDQGYYNAAAGTTSTNYYYDGLASVPYSFAAGVSSIQVPIAIHDRGLTSGSEKFSFQVQSTSGSNLASTTFTIVNSDHASTTTQPSPTDVHPTININGPSTFSAFVSDSVNFTSSITANDPDGSVEFYQFQRTSGSGVFMLGGVDSGASVKVPAPQLFRVGFHAEASAGTDQIQVQAIDNQGAASTPLNIGVNVTARNALTQTNALVLLHLSQDSYVKSPIGTDGFRPIPFDSSGLTADDIGGFRAVAYSNDPTNADPSQVVIAIRGSDNLENWIFNIASFGTDTIKAWGPEATFLSPYFNDAVTFLQSVEAKYPHATIQLTGHSLGGAIAELLGEAAHLNVTAFDAPGARDFYPTLLADTLSGQADWLTQQRAQRPQWVASVNDSNIRLFGDIVSKVGQPIGQTITLSQLFSTDLNIFYDHDLNALSPSVEGYVFENLTPVQPNVDEPLDLTSIITSVAATGATGIETIGSSVVSWLGTAFKKYFIDPSPASDFVYTQDQNSPNIVSIDLPLVPGVQSYELRYEIGNSWSAFQQVWPDQWYAFGPNVNGVEFIPLDSSGHAISVTDPILFGLIFGATGAINGTITVRAATHAPTPDFNADAKSDLLLLNDTTHGVAEWLIDGTQAIAKPQIGTVNAADGWHYQTTGDFNGDGKTDLLLLNDTTHGVAEWLMDGTQAIAKPQVGTVNAADGWHYQTTGDFNGDGKTDLLLLNDTTHGVAEWLMDGTQAIAKPQVGTVNAGDGWHFQTTGDFNGDGKTDLLLLNDTTHGVAEWLMDGTQAIAKPQVGTVNAADGWHFQTTGDFNGDGKTDLLLLNDTNHGVAVWLMDGTQAIAKPQVGTVNAADGWHFQDVGDFNGDGKSDLLLLNDTTHGVAVWLMDGTQAIAKPQIGTINAADGWRYDGLRDFNGDGKTDLLLDNGSTHGVAEWLMDGTQAIAKPQIGTVNAADGWHLVI